MKFISLYINKMKDNYQLDIKGILLRIFISALVPFAFGIVMPPFGFVLVILFEFCRLYFYTYYIIVFILFFLYSLVIEFDER